MLVAFITFIVQACSCDAPPVIVERPVVSTPVVVQKVVYSPQNTSVNVAKPNSLERKQPLRFPKLESVQPTINGSSSPKNPDVVLAGYDRQESKTVPNQKTFDNNAKSVPPKKLLVALPSGLKRNVVDAADTVPMLDIKKSDEKAPEAAKQDKPDAVATEIRGQSSGNVDSPERTMGSIPPDPQGLSDVRLPAEILGLSSTTPPSNTDTDDVGSAQVPDRGGSGTVGPQTPTRPDANPPRQRPDYSDSGFGDGQFPMNSQQHQDSRLNSQSTWTVTALIMLSALSTGAFMFMLFVVQDYRRRWLEAIMSQTDNHFITSPVDRYMDYPPMPSTHHSEDWN